MNVLVYSGPDIASTSVSDTLSSLRSLLIPNYAVQSVTTQALIAHPWSTSCSLFVLPSLLPSTAPSSSLKPSEGTTLHPAALKAIQNYISNGGRLLALGTGLRVRSRQPSGMLALSAQIAGVSIIDTTPSPAAAKSTLEDSDLRLSFSLMPATLADADVARAVVQTPDGSRVDGLTRAGEVDLTEVADVDRKSIKTLAHVSAEPTLESESKGVVGIQAAIGRGLAAFWSVHLESVLTNDKDERARVAFLRQTLQQLGLRLPSDTDALQSPRPTPQILSGAPWREGVVERILSTLGVPAPADSQTYEYKDSNDTFVFHASEDASHAFAAQRTDLQAKADPALWNPKRVVVYTEGRVPEKDLNPRFNIAKYYEELKEARAERGCPASYPDGGWGAGEALLYGEAVTSTQTMLDKNNRLLTTLPAPILSLASAQLTGRGRGANVWLSPPGCLQFSLLVRVPLAQFPASKIVFVQYLFALAVAEACRAPGVIGNGKEGERVRIKWPNDLYAVTRDGEKRKIGGILVNTSFGAGKVELVIGCGLNVLNPPPIPSLGQLVEESGSGAAAAPTMERTLAAIMARFERMWDEFVRERGSFALFMDLYLERWLHSDQLVTLTTVTPERKVRIVGITPDHGLLRTLPERDASSAWGGGSGIEYIDLQPDGNSFDLMAGLIKTKT